MSTVLDKIEHARLIADMEHICLTAGVQSAFLSSSMKDFCGDKEVDWVRRFNEHRANGTRGIVLLDVPKPDTRCQAIAAAFLRNFIDARVIPLNTLLAMQEDKVVPLPTVLLIPNLYVHANCNNISPWKIQAIYDLFLDRAVKGKSTVVYVEDMDGLMKHYGKPFADFLTEKFIRATS